jgi:tetratricopeptide (TPR) repeat protein
MVETLINALGSVEGLRVPARTSAFYFKGKNTPLQEIGKKLNVEYVLEASVQVEGEKLRVIPRLLNVADGYQIWSEKYDRGREDIFAIEDDVARMVVENLKIQIMAERSSPLIRPETENLEAHNLYLKGRYLWSKRGFVNVSNAVQYFEKAIDLDPQYARGYAGLSMAYVILGDNLFLAPREAFPKARAYAIKALELDDHLAEAHYSLGVVKQAYHWDFAGAEREFKRAMELNPRDGYTRQAYAYLLMDFGKHDEAIKEMRLARDLDPLALRIRANVGFILYMARKYSEAEQVLKEELQLEPQNCAVYDFLAGVYRETGRFDLAVEFIRRTDECFHPGRNMRLFAVQTAYAYARMGKPEEGRRILNSIEGPSADDDYDNSYGSRVYLAAAYAWLGDKDKAFSLLEEAYAERDARMTYLKSEPSLDPLRSDPRFTDLLCRIGLEK